MGRSRGNGPGGGSRPKEKLSKYGMYIQQVRGGRGGGRGS